MGKCIDQLTPDLISFIEDQHLFFVATAMKDGRVNTSPKGMDTLRVINENRVVWLNLTGSGNETAAHLLHENRITIMFCAFEGKPMILRLYGTGKVYHEHDDFWEEHINLFPKISGSRQLIDVQIDLVQTSCGMAVPLMEFKGEREDLKLWAEKQGEERLMDYKKKKNTISLDGLPTGILSK